MEKQKLLLVYVYGKGNERKGKGKKGKGRERKGKGRKGKEGKEMENKRKKLSDYSPSNNIQ